MWQAVSKFTGRVLFENDIRKNVTKLCEYHGIPRNSYVLKRAQVMYG